MEEKISMCADIYVLMQMQACIYIEKTLLLIQAKVGEEFTYLFIVLFHTTIFIGRIYLVHCY